MSWSPDRVSPHHSGLHCRTHTCTHCRCRGRDKFIYIQFSRFVLFSLVTYQGNLFQAVSPHTIRGHKAWRCTALKRLQPLLMSGLSRHQARTSCRRYPRKQVSPLVHALAVAGQSAPSPSASTAPASELHLSPQRRLRSHFWMQPRRRIEAHLWLEEAQQYCKVLRARIAFLRVCAVAPTAF